MVYRGHRTLTQTATTCQTREEVSHFFYTLNRTYTTSPSLIT